MSFGIFPLLNLFLYFQIIPSLAVGCLLTLSGLGLDRKTEELDGESEIFLQTQILKTIKSSQCQPAAMPRTFPTLHLISISEFMYVGEPN